MCGVVGYYGFGRPCDPGALERAIARLAHRGPDDAGRLLDRDVGLGHRRLAVMDPEGGAQPVRGCRGVRAVVNGELYGFEAQRARLEAEGHRFSTRSDSEVLVHLYEAHGLAAVEQLRGELAFVLYDPARRRLVAGRDRFGIEPLVYTMHEGALWIASEVAALFAAGAPRGWDEDALLFALRLQYVPEGATLFRGVRAVPPGALLIAEPSGIRVERYWDLDFPRAEELEPVPEAAERVRAALDEAVQVRLRSDVPVATLLSGGLDSSAVAGLAARAGGVRAAFTVGFEPGPYDERALAARTAARLGLEHHVVPAPAEALLEAYEAAVISAGGLLVNPHGAAKRLLSEAVRDAGYKVVLSGEGADEVFAGYPHFRADLLGAGSAEHARLVADNPVSRGVLVADARAEGFERVEAALGFVPGLLRTKAALGATLEGLLSPEWAARHRSFDVQSRLLTPGLLGQLEGRTRLAQAQVLAAKLSLSQYILPMFDDAQEMAFGLEARMPFLDHHLFEVARRLPDEAKIRGHEEKHVLREACRDLLTAGVSGRRKHPFFAPPVLARDRARLRAWTAEAPPIFDRARLEAAWDRLEGASDADLAAAEPALSMVVSATLLARAYRL